MTHRMSQAIRCSLDSSEIFHTAVHELGSYLNADRCSLFMKDEKNNCAKNVAEYHADGVSPAATTFELEDVRVLIESLDKNGVLCFNDAAHDPRIADVYERILARANVRAITYVASRVGDEGTAAVALSTTRVTRDCSLSDIPVAKAVADQPGLPTRQPRLCHMAGATSKREVLLNRLTMAIRASLSLADVLSTASRELGVALEASRVHLHLYDPDDPISRVEHEYIASGCDSISSFQISYDDVIGRHLLGISKPLVIDDAFNYQRSPPEFAAAVRSHARAAHIRRSEE